MRIEELILRGVGPFEEARFVFPAGRDPDLADVHLLVGPNGSGKTTALRAIAQFLSVMDVGLAGRTWGDSPLYLRTDAGWNALTDNASRTSLDDPDGEPLWNGFPTVAFPGKAPFRHWGQWAESHVRDGRQIAFFGYASDRPMFGTPEAQGAEWSTTDTADLVTWIQNQITKAALAQARQDAGAAERHLLPVRTVEQALSRLWGRLLRFELREEPLTLMMRVDGAAVPTDHLPSGLQTTLAWLGDLMMWLDRGETPPGQSPLHQPVVLLLDEITVHLHPAWQRQILPLVQRLLPKAQIFLATHSPFVVASAADAWIHPLRLDREGRAMVGEPLPTRLGHSYPDVLAEVFGVEEMFDVDTEARLQELDGLCTRRLRGEDVSAELDPLVALLRARSDELDDLVTLKLRHVQRALQAAG